MPKKKKTKTEEKQIIKKSSLGADVDVDEGEATPQEYPREIDDPYDIEMKSITKELEEQLPKSTIKILKRVAYEIGTIGLKEEEACLLANLPHEKFIYLKKNFPLIDRLMDIKNLEYERGILKNLSEKAKRDDKLGQWLLERRNPNKYNRRKGAAGGGDEEEEESMIAAMIEFVQDSEDRKPVVSQKSGKAFMMKRKRSKGGDEKIDIKKILS